MTGGALLTAAAAGRRGLAAGLAAAKAFGANARVAGAGGIAIHGDDSGGCRGPEVACVIEFAGSSAAGLEYLG